MSESETAPTASPPDTEASPGFSTFTKVRDAATALYAKYSADEVPIHAMSLTYTTILSLVPLLAVTFSVLKGFGVQNQIEPLLANALAPLGPKGDEITAQIIGFVDNLELRVLGAAGIAGLLYTVISLVGAIENALNKIWHARQARGMAIKFRDYLSVVLLGPVLVFTALGLTATATQHSAVQTALEVAPWLLWLGTVLLPNLILGTAFTLLYKFLPNTQVSWKGALVGGFVAGITWKLAGTAFTNFVVTSGRYSAIYSGFAIILLFIIWIYFNWLIVLVGGEIAFFVQQPSSVLGAARDKTIIAREECGLMVAMALAESHRRGEGPLTTWELASRAGLSPPVVDDIVDHMLEHGMVLRSKKPDGVAIARALETISVFEVLDIVRGGDIEAPTALPPAVRGALDRRTSAVKTELGSTSLADLVRPADGEGP